jgi:transposase
MTAATQADNTQVPQGQEAHPANAVGAKAIQALARFCLSLPRLRLGSTLQVVHPSTCECGHSGLVTSVPYHTHQVIELPPIEMQITHFELHQGHCVGCGQLLKAKVASRINLAKWF